MNWLRTLSVTALTAGLLTGCGSGSAPQSTLELTAQGSYCAGLARDGRQAVVGAFNHGGSLWDLQRRERLYDWNHAEGEYSVLAACDFSPQGRYALTASQQDMVLWQTHDGQPAGFWSAPAEILSLALAPNGDAALLGLANHEAVYFDVKNGGILRSLRHKARVGSVALSPDTGLALTGDDNYTSTLWDLQSGEQLHQLSFGNVVDTVALAPQGNLAFSAATLDKAVVWDTRTGKVRYTLSDFRGLFEKRFSYLSARFSEDGRKLLTGSASGLVQLWDMNNGRELKRWRIARRHSYGPTYAGVYAVGFAQQGYYAIGSNGILNTLR